MAVGGGLRNKQTKCRNKESTQQVEHHFTFLVLLGLTFTVKNGWKGKLKTINLLPYPPFYQSRFPLDKMNISGFFLFTKFLKTGGY